MVCVECAYWMRCCPSNVDLLAARRLCSVRFQILQVAWMQPQAPHPVVSQVRIVGVETLGEARKQYTVYRLAVEAEGGASWEVARRFSDFQVRQ